VKLLIKFIDFLKSYKNNIIIKESNFIIPNSKVSFFMGPNGVGKTTLIKCLLGLEKYKGEILYDSYDIEKVRNKIIVLWDDCPFIENLSGWENLIILSEKLVINKEELKSQIREYMDDNLIKRQVKTYSYGQRKKLALILLNILKPEIIIMDEISNGLDYDLMQSLRKDILKMAKNHTIILTGHQFGFYEGIIDLVYIIKDGEILLIEDNYKESTRKLEDIYENNFKGQT